MKKVSYYRHFAKVIEKKWIFWWSIFGELKGEFRDKFTLRLCNETRNMQNMLPLVSYNILPNFKWKYWEEKIFLKDFAYIQISFN